MSTNQQFSSEFSQLCDSNAQGKLEAVSTKQLMIDFETQDQNLKRVKSKTAVAILQFFDSLEVGSEFHAQELRDFVAKLVPVAPASPDRILRDMRQRGELNYEVVSRPQSLYRKLK